MHYNHCYCAKAHLQLIYCINIIIIIIIIIIIVISFMQGIYTNHVPREHCVATILM